MVCAEADSPLFSFENSAFLLDTVSFSVWLEVGASFETEGGGFLSLFWSLFMIWFVSFSLFYYKLLSQLHLRSISSFFPFKKLLVNQLRKTSKGDVFLHWMVR